MLIPMRLPDWINLLNNVKVCWHTHTQWSSPEFSASSVLFNPQRRSRSLPLNPININSHTRRWREEDELVFCMETSQTWHCGSQFYVSWPHKTQSRTASIGFSLWPLCLVGAARVSGCLSYYSPFKRFYLNNKIKSWEKILTNKYNFCSFLCH